MQYFNIDKNMFNILKKLFLVKSFTTPEVIFIQKNTAYQLKSIRSIYILLKD